MGIYNGGLVAHGVKHIDTLVTSSCNGEMKASTFASEHGEVAVHALITFGRDPATPFVLGTDNSANLAISMGTAQPQRVKASLTQWACLKDRIKRGVAMMTKIDTDKMPVDFMTKWIKGEKMQAQLAYLLNSQHAVWPA